MRERLSGWIVAFLGTALIVSCGGGGSNSPRAEAEAAVQIADRGFAESGILTGALGLSEVLLILDEGRFFLLAGDLAARGEYAVSSVNFSAVGTAYRTTAESQNIGEFLMSGEYRTDRHLDLTWTEASGDQQTLIVEATTLYFEPKGLESVVGAWINQDEGNLVFLNISENTAPVAGDDLTTGDQGETLEIAVLANDRDLDGDVLTITAVDAESRRGVPLRLLDAGTPEDPGDDLIEYTIPADFEAGSDDFMYTIDDGNEGTANADVTVTFPSQETDVSVSLAASDLMPDAGEVIRLTATVHNHGLTDVRAQMTWVLPDGLIFRNSESAGAYDSSTGFWTVELAADAGAELWIDALVAGHGTFATEIVVSALDAIETNHADNQASLVLTPGNLVSAPTLRRSANVSGIILSTFTQVTGSITEHRAQLNALRLELSLGGGGFGGGSGDTDPYVGFAVIGAEEVEVEVDTGDGTDGDTASGDDAVPTETQTELRTTMLILTANPGGVFLNKLFFIRDDELETDE